MSAKGLFLNNSKSEILVIGTHQQLAKVKTDGIQAMGDLSSTLRLLLGTWECGFMLTYL